MGGRPRLGSDGQVDAGPQALHVSEWAELCKERQGQHAAVSKLLSQATLRPLTSLRMLMLCSIDGMGSFEGWRSFKQELLAAQREMGVAPADLKLEGLRIRGRGSC